eukprot:CAMPEP_0198286618 /NCGR_PEP_ID=MMETSP1449-20131203/5658_1 /TAXON_ID=420275 /ORGANISM="Attheya septentrionalis, Strain CCMP2084" /LENGTH=953 /DNA_ID=CAMNT_0043984403 /DNA_START=139 /DNA_END=3000 /DNA_ORIENTATION=+
MLDESSWFSEYYSVVWIFVSVLLLLLLCVQQQKRLSGQVIVSSSQDIGALERKKDFVTRAGDDYGYRDDDSGGGGHNIDHWRSTEFPGLIPPLGTSTASKSHDDEAEVYLDYAGSALPSVTQLSHILNDGTQILANPHSAGPAASRTTRLVNQATKLVLDHFNCHADPDYGPYLLKDSKRIPHQLASNRQKKEPHPGYEVIFTSGSTESLRLVAELFPWCGDNQEPSILLYPQQAHTSVVGMRACAQSCGAIFQCEPLDTICNASANTFSKWTKQQAGVFDEQMISGNSTSSQRDTNQSNSEETVVNHLLALPLECNFSGDRPDVSSAMAAARSASSRNHQWHFLLDIAKAASTGPVDLKALDPDFACISFYKLFGEPTGLGALFVKRNKVDLLKLLSHNKPRYFGGGSVDVVLPGKDFMVARSEPSLLASLKNGTIHFRGIASLIHGFRELDRVGGMEKISKHARSLAKELVRRLTRIHHGNGKRAVVIYGAWTKQKESNMSVSPGPTVAFNIVRQDESFVGYNEVSKLAMLHRPPLQLRTGCFCNPGACQKALGLSDKDIHDNYVISGHVCGDQIDIIQNRSTGAIRVSFGKDSIWEDLDALVTFIEKQFVNYTTDGTKPSINQLNKDVLPQNHLQLSEMYIFPIKSCVAMRVKRWQISRKTGKLKYDREFALVDSSGSAMRMYSYPRMALIRPVIDLNAGLLIVSAPNCKDLVLRLDQFKDASDCGGSVKVCGNKCGGRIWGNRLATEWFSSFLGVQCWLARYSNNSEPFPCDNTAAVNNRNSVAFSNEAPLMLLSEDSISTLNEVLSAQGQKLTTSMQFRPNLVVRNTLKRDVLRENSSPNMGKGKETLNGNGWNPEDSWSTVTIPDRDLKLTVVGQCARCSMVDYDPTTGMKGKTLRALADYRRQQGQIMFGIFLRATDDMHLTNKQADGTEYVLIEEGDMIGCSQHA